MKPTAWLIFVALAIPVLGGCNAGSHRRETVREKTSEPNSLQLRSSDFSSANAIPAQFTCDGANISPALSWNAPPAATKSFALIMYDQNTPEPLTHWQVFNLPPDTRSLPQGVGTKAQLPQGAEQTVNGHNKIGYAGPCPPQQGPTHHYVFQLYALDTTLKLPQNTDQQNLRSAMKGHILAEGKFIATYHHNSQLPPAKQNPSNRTK